MVETTPGAGGFPAQPLEDSPAERDAELRRELSRQMRKPFERALFRLLKFRPTAEALQAFANKSPDRWAQAIGILGNLAGYEKGINVTVNVKNINDMSDVELLEEYRRQVTQVAALARGTVGEVVDAEVLPLPQPDKVIRE
jgi:hypothetical protein